MVVLISKTYTGNPVLDEAIDNSRSILLQGVAGAGKTTLLLTIAGNLCNENPCVYISTEETVHYERVARNPDKYEKALFTEAYDLDTLLKIVLALPFIKPKYVFVDSINAPYRVEMKKESTQAKQTLIISALLNIVEREGGKLFASAQVRAEESGDIVASGLSILEYYFDLILEVLIMRSSLRSIKVFKSIRPHKIESLCFLIREQGVEWCECE